MIVWPAAPVRGWWMRGSGKALIVLAATAVLARVAAADGPAVTARAAMVMDAATGNVLWERNAEEPLPPASTTKVMTAILALESGDLERSFPVSASAADTAPSSIGLRAGQRMQLRHLLYALMLHSANDAAEVIAEGLGGSTRSFGEEMTAKAHLFGATTAQFRNPHGLTMPGHVASARDLAVIFRRGLDMPQFRDLLGTSSMRVPVEAKRVRWVSLRSHNRLLSGYTYRVIGKTGYTRAAGRCYVGAASRDGREIIVAMLGSRDLWGDAKRLVAFGMGESPEEPAVVTASAAPARRERQAAEGDDETGAESYGTRYAVRLGPYRSQTAAVAARQRLARRGYTARVTGRSLHIGSFSSLSRAEHVATRLRKTGYAPTVVLL